MALDKLIDSTQLDGAMGSTADAIRAKTGGSALLEWDMDTGFDEAIGAILTPADGSIPTKTSSDLTVSGKTVTAPAGYYASDVSKSVADGAYDVDVISHSVTQPVVTGAINGTVNNIATTSKPTGTDGTDYWTITPKGSNTSTGFSIAKGKATITTAGYIASGSKETSESSVNITSTVLAGTESYIAKGTVTNNTSGGTSIETINRGSQIKIGAGYYPSNLYYTSQANSGTLNITASGAISCDGYANVSVPKTAIIVEVTATSNTTTTISNSNITTNHYVYNTTSTVPLSDISWTTSDGSLTLTCSNGIPAMYVLLCRNM